MKNLKKADMAQKKTKNNRFVDERSYMVTWNHGVNLVLNVNVTKQKYYNLL